MIFFLTLDAVAVMRRFGFVLVAYAPKACRRLSTMSDVLGKLCQRTNGAQTGPTSCTEPGYYLIHNLTTISAKTQRFIDATKMLVEIAKESADACPPLKSCLGGICELIKHYEVRP